VASLSTREPNVAVLITNYNKGDSVFLAVESVLPQLRSGDELVLVDDCSDDDFSAQAKSRISDPHLNCVYFKTPSRLGAAGAKNLAVSLASREYVVLLDADDFLASEAISRIREAFVTWPDASIIFGDYFEWREGWDQPELVSTRSLADANGWLDPRRLAVSWKLLGTSPFTRALFDSIGGFDAKYPITDDVDFFRKAFSLGHKARYVSAPLYHWNRSRSGNNSAATPRIVAAAWMRSSKFYRLFLNKRVFLVRSLEAFLTLILDKKISLDRHYKFFLQWVQRQP
jgi:glycosyltransferase involved in cell wall biosynthesis